MDSPPKRPIPMLDEQIVPGSVCSVCEVCCRFPDADSPLRPYFTSEEIQAAIAAGVSPDAFPDHGGSKIRVVPLGDGYRCPAFDPASGRCTIYQARPLDCQLYPVAVMRDSDDEGVVMGWDAKCPFIAQKLEAPESRAYAERTTDFLETDVVSHTFAMNPQLVGAFQDDVIVLKPLKRITYGLRKETEKRNQTPFSLRPLTWEDRARFETSFHTQALLRDPLAAYSFPYHFIWRELLAYEWAELAGHSCLLAATHDGGFLALPPVGPDPAGPAMQQAFDLLAERNRLPEMSRIENVPETMAERCRAAGYTAVANDPEYLYRREDLVALKGDRYKSQRASCNQCLKQFAPSIREYGSQDLEDCLNLFEQWRAGVKTEPVDYARSMAADAATAHRTALTHARELGLRGLVSHIGGQLTGYTLGYPLNSSVFCILLEITDRRIAGLPQYLFREFCTRLSEYVFINTLDDSGLDGLRKAKERYHPIRLLQRFTIRPQGSRGFTGTWTSA